jgi:proteasome lid subunit RPN8/RPN11
LRFSPTAWAKLLFLRDCGPTEVGAFGLTPGADLLYVADIRLVRQACSVVSVAFDDTAVAEFFDEQVDAGLRPEQFGRIWIHSHPGASAEPSFVDEETFARVFGTCDWSLMFILARGGESYCRLRFSAGPGGAFEIPVEVTFECAFAGSDFAAWGAEYAAAVRQAALTRPFDDGRAHVVGVEGLSLSDHEIFEDFKQTFQQRKDLLFHE